MVNPGCAKYNAEMLAFIFLLFKAPLCKNSLIPNQLSCPTYYKFTVSTHLVLTGEPLISYILFGEHYI